MLGSVYFCLFTVLLPVPALGPMLSLQEAQATFFQELSGLCGAKFEGYSTFPDDPDDAFAGKKLVAEFKKCTQDEIRISFAVGEDTSRTWVLTQSEKGLLLKHDHRHADGTPDEITMYGGWADDRGNQFTQFFPADSHTKELIPAAATNVWQLRYDPIKKTLTYDLKRHGKRRFTAVLKSTDT